MEGLCIRQMKRTYEDPGNRYVIIDRALTTLSIID